jgi:drug/metabolite transporter (DMT)-like permease
VNPLGIVCALAAIAIYAGMFAVGRSGAASGLNGFDQTALRFAFSGIAVLPLTLWFGRSALIKLGWAKLLGLVVLGGSVYSAVFLSGLVFAPVAFGAALVPGLQPIAVLILSSVLFSEQVTPRKLAGPAVCLVGMMVMMIASSAVMKPGYSIGIALFVSAAAMWGAYAVALKAWSVEPMEALAMTAPLSALVFLPVYMSIRGLAPILDAPLSASLLQVAYQGVLVGIAAVFLYASAVKISGSIAVSSLSPAMPVLAIMIGWWLLGVPSRRWWESEGGVISG